MVPARLCRPAYHSEEELLSEIRWMLELQKLVRGAASGYSSYGNQIGLATGYVKEIYHPDYVAKRMEIGAVGVEGVGMTGTAGPGHLIAVSRDEIGALGVILCSSLLCLFPLGDAAALGEAGQIIVAA